MQLINPTLGQLERLHLLGCPVVIHDGVPHAPITGLIVARANAVVHGLRVLSLRAYWKRMRRMDACLGFADRAFWESYMVLKYQCRQELPSRWFRRV